MEPVPGYRVMTLNLGAEWYTVEWHPTLRPSRCYALFILAGIKAQSVIFLLKEPLQNDHPFVVLW